MNRLNRFVWFLFMIIIGGGVGLYYSWYVKPAEFVDAVMFNLRQDYKTDYVLMTSEIYDQDHDRYRAMVRLEKILAPGDTMEEAVQTAIRHAEGFGYNPVDLEKMRHLYEMVTGQRATPTPQYDPTMVYEIQMTSTAMAVSSLPEEKPTQSKNSGSAPASGGSGSGSVTEADQDPFGTGIQITTDPNAVPALELPSAPTITPAGMQGPSEQDIYDPGFDSFPEDNDPPGFSGIPDSFFEGN